MNPKILFEGKFNRDSVHYEYHEVSSRKIDPKIEKKANKIWVDKVKEATKSGKKIWDQEVYRLDSFEVKDNRCYLEFSTIPFSIRSSIKEFTNELISLGDEYLPMATYSTIFVETLDAKFVFGEKSDVFAANRQYSYFGGVYNKPLDGLDADLFDSSISELQEELGLSQSDIAEISLVGALRTESCNVAFIFYAKLNIDSKSLVKRFNTQNDQEMKSLFFGTRKDIRQICNEKIGKESEFVDIFEKHYNA